MLIWRVLFASFSLFSGNNKALSFFPPPPSPVIPAADKQADRAPWSRHDSPTAKIYHFRWCVSCRGLSPSYTHSHTTTAHKINTHTLVPSGEINFTGSHGELWFPGAPHALCRRRRSLHTTWLLTLHHYRGQRTSNPSLQEEEEEEEEEGWGCSIPRLQRYRREARLAPF